MNRYTFFDEFSLVGSNMVLDPNIKQACNGNDGSIDLAVTGGTSPFTYSWTGPSAFSSTVQNLSGLIPGKYEVRVTDANNCIAIKEYEVFGYSTAIIYVDLNATGNNTGMNWKHAYTDLQSALARARTTCGGDIWVSEGVYYPTPSGGDPETAFEMVPSYGIYGGFKTATDDTTWLDRNWVNYETILSGQLVGTYNIIRNYNIGLARDAILDGFTVQDGNSIARNGPQGAMFNGIDSPTIRHCIFKDNAAVYGSTINNIANAAQIWHCTFFNNSCDNHGGAIYNNTTTVLIMNSLFYDNEAGTGGALSLSSSHDTIVNCTFTENRANITGGALSASFSKETIIVNTIIWNNECDPNWPFFAGVVGSGVNHTGNEPIYFHSDVQNTNSTNPLTGLQFTWLFKGQDAGGNWDDDPVFIDPSNKDFRLDPGSNMIDQGDNSFSSNIDYDLDSNIRILQNDVDLGAYEVDPDFKRTISIRSHLASKPLYEVFPNPNNGLFTVKRAREGAYFKIISLAGQIIVEKQQLFDSPIDISNHPKGVYMLIIIDKDKETSLPIMKN